MAESMTMVWIEMAQDGVYGQTFLLQPSTAGFPVIHACLILMQFEGNLAFGTWYYGI
jgi:hypothetical protein